MTHLIVGLGNPGPEYVGTRHNVGFEVVEHLAGLLEDDSGKRGLLFRTASKLDGYSGPRCFLAARGFSTSSRADVLLVKPETWMNRTGEAVAPLARWAEVPPEQILVVYDDMDLPVGGLRIRPFGGAGGHNGMRSILHELGSDRFPRLRVGIGRPRTDAARHVLEPFGAHEAEEIAISIAEASEAILFWLENGDLEVCMTRFHSRWKTGREG